MNRQPKDCQQLWDKFYYSFAGKGHCDSDTDSYTEFIEAAKHDINKLNKVCTFLFLILRVISELTFTFVICCHPSVCRLSSVTLVHPSGINILAGGSSVPLISERKETDPHWKHLRCTHFVS